MLTRRTQLIEVIRHVPPEPRALSQFTLWPEYRVGHDGSQSTQDASRCPDPRGRQL